MSKANDKTPVVLTFWWDGIAGNDKTVKRHDVGATVEVDHDTARSLIAAGRARATEAEPEPVTPPETAVGTADAPDTTPAPARGGRKNSQEG